MTTWTGLKAETSDELMPVLKAIGMSWRKLADAEGRTGEYTKLVEKVRERYNCAPGDDTDTILGAYFLRSMRDRDKLAVAYVLHCAMAHVERHDKTSLPAIRRTIVESARALKALRTAEDKSSSPGVSQ